ncbi:MAG: hypothetical protein JNK05_15295 [Myxococcales bacterium]|nr:hypothetical protein [Myxococcales bacterium]
MTQWKPGPDAEFDEYARYFEVDRRRIELALERLSSGNLSHLAALDASLARAMILSGAPKPSTTMATADAAASGCAAALSSTFGSAGLHVCLRRSSGRTFLVRDSATHALHPMAWLTTLSCAILAGCDEIGESLARPRVILNALRNIEEHARPTWTALALYWRELANGPGAPDYAVLERAADRPNSDHTAKRLQLTLLLPTLRLAASLTSEDDFAFASVVSDELRALRGRTNCESLLPVLALVTKAAAMGRPLPAAVEALAPLDASMQSRRPSAHLRFPDEWLWHL